MLVGVDLGLVEALAGLLLGVLGPLGLAAMLYYEHIRLKQEIDVEDDNQYKPGLTPPTQSAR